MLRVAFLVVAFFVGVALRVGILLPSFKLGVLLLLRVALRVGIVLPSFKLGVLLLLRVAFFVFFTLGVWMSFRVVVPLVPALLGEVRVPWVLP